MKKPTPKPKDPNSRVYGNYEVIEEYRSDGSYAGYRVSRILSTNPKMGKLFKVTDGRENYKEKPKDEELEI